MPWTIQNKVNGVWGGTKKIKYANFKDAYERWKSIHRIYGIYRIVKMK